MRVWGEVQGERVKEECDWEWRWVQVRESEEGKDLAYESTIVFEEGGAGAWARRKGRKRPSVWEQYYMDDINFTPTKIMRDNMDY